MLSLTHGCWCFSLAVVDLSLHPAGESVTELLSHSCVFMLFFFPYVCFFPSTVGVNGGLMFCLLVICFVCLLAMLYPGEKVM